MKTLGKIYSFFYNIWIKYFVLKPYILSLTWFALEIKMLSYWDTTTGGKAAFDRFSKYEKRLIKFGFCPISLNKMIDVVKEDTSHETLYGWKKHTLELSHCGFNKEGGCVLWSEKWWEKHKNAFEKAISEKNLVVSNSNKKREAINVTEYLKGRQMLYA